MKKSLIASLLSLCFIFTACSSDDSPVNTLDGGNWVSKNRILSVDDEQYAGRAKQINAYMSECSFERSFEQNVFTYRITNNEITTYRSDYEYELKEGNILSSMGEESYRFANENTLLTEMKVDALQIEALLRQMQVIGGGGSIIPEDMTGVIKTHEIRK